MAVDSEVSSERRHGGTTPSARQEQRLGVSPLEGDVIHVARHSHALDNEEASQLQTLTASNERVELRMYVNTRTADA
jgi:hypothetical protein